MRSRLRVAVQSRLCTCRQLRQETLTVLGQATGPPVVERHRPFGRTVPQPRWFQAPDGCPHNAVVLRLEHRIEVTRELEIVIANKKAQSLVALGGRLSDRHLLRHSTPSGWAVQPVRCTRRIALR